MKNTYSLTWYAAALMLVSTTTFTSLAQAKADEEVSGVLTHIIEDDFENGKERHHLRIHDPKTKKSKKLVFKDDKIPEKLLHAPSGAKIKVKGKKTEDDVTVAYDGSNYDFIFENTSFVWKRFSVTGTKSVLAVQVDFNDGLGSCGSEAAIFKNTLDPTNQYSTKNFMKKSSQNLVDITGKTARVKLNLNVSSTTVCKEPDFNKWADMADQMLNNAGHNVSSYDHRIYFIPNIPACEFGGVAYIGGGENWTQSKARGWIKWCNPKVISHELAHNFGYAHAAAGEGTASWDAYGDVSDTMGRGQNQEFNAAHKYQVGWIPSSKIVDITANGTYKVAPLNAVSASAAYPQIFRVYKSAKEYYYLSYRDRSGIFDANLPLTYAGRLNITKWTEDFNYYTHFINALGAGGSAILPSTSVTVKANAVNASYIEFSVSGLSATSTPTTDTTVPSVSLSSPLNGSTYNAGATVTASATASDNVAVSKVAFYVGGVLKSSDSTSPYNYSFSMPTSSSLSVYAIAYDAAGNLKKSAISYIKNPTTIADTTVPYVYLSSPLNGSTYNAGATVTVSATASDNKAVSKVAFYVGGVLKSSDSTSPYNYSFSMPTSSSLSVYAIAYDAAGNLKKSAISYIKNPTTIADTTAPSVTLSGPANGATFAAGASVNASATASDNKAVSKVLFYVGGVLKSTDTVAPYNYSFSMPTSSSLSVYAIAYDAAGNLKKSAISYIKNPTTTTADTINPVVRISSPASGSSYAPGSKVTLSISATDNVGVKYVYCYTPNGWILASQNAPYTCSFTMPSNDFRTYAYASDDARNGIRSTSALLYAKASAPVTTDTLVPSVQLSSPLNGSTYASGASVTVSATASDNVGVAKVLFYVGGAYKSTDTTAPYNYSFSMPTSSSLSVYAIAYDAAGNLKKSAISYIKNPTTTTADTIRPEAYITSPVNGSKIASGSTFTVTASASDNKAVTKVVFYFNGKYCTDYTAPYSCNLLMPTGSNQMIRATAYDAANNYKYSPLVYVSN